MLICTSPGQTTALSSHITHHTSHAQHSTQLPPSPPPLPPQTMSTSEASDDHFNKYAPGHMPMPDFEALAQDIQNRVSRCVGALPARRPRHRGGRDGGAGAMGPSPDELCAGGSGTRRVGSGGRHRHMPVHDIALGDQEGGEGAAATGGGGDYRGGEDGGELAGTPSSAGLGPSRRSSTTTDSVR